MVTWIIVYKDTMTSYLCKRYGDHYEIEAEGSSTSIGKLVETLNEKETNGD